MKVKKIKLYKNEHPKKIKIISKFIIFLIQIM